MGSFDHIVGTPPPSVHSGRLVLPARLSRQPGDAPSSANELHLDQANDALTLKCALDVEGNPVSLVLNDPIGPELMRQRDQFVDLVEHHVRTLSTNDVSRVGSLVVENRR